MKDDRLSDHHRHHIKQLKNSLAEPYAISISFGVRKILSEAFERLSGNGVTAERTETSERASVVGPSTEGASASEGALLGTLAGPTDDGEIEAVAQALSETKDFILTADPKAVARVALAASRRHRGE